MNKNFLIISNDKLFIKHDKISSDYNDTINIIEGLAEKNHLSFFCRTTIKPKNYISKKKKYKKFLRFKFFDLNRADNHEIFMISITLFNFFTLLFLKILNNKTTGYVYLRSDGHKEYYYKYGTIGRTIYSFMFKVVTSTLKIISVSKNLTGLKNNYSLVTPSEIDKKWFVNRVNPNLYKPKLLYLGRYKKEKGVFSLINIINSLSTDLKLNIVGTKQKIISTNKKIKFSKELSSIRSIISCYDECNIFVLPSYTEGSPKVILESLARHRPVIVFEDIKHVKKNFKGVFVCKRNNKDFLNNINFILNNYSQINKKIKKEKIFTKKDFQKQLSKITL